MSNFKQGIYTLRNPEKYLGDPNNVVYRSSWELNMHKFLDNNPNVIKWASEEIAIPYLKPTDKKIHRYFPDYYVEYKDRFDNICKEIIEVKPATQTKAPRKGNRKNILYEQLTYAINIAKWQAANEFCKKHGIKFKIVTENQLFK